MLFAQGKGHLFDVLGQSCKKVVEEFRRAMNLSLGEENLAAVFLYDALLRPDISSDVIFCMGVLLPLRIDIRLHEGNDLMDGDSLAQKDIVHDLKARQKGHPLTIIKVRATRSFIDILRGRHRNDEDIPLLLRLFQMLDMAIMQEIEDSMAKHDLLPCIAKALPQSQKSFFADDLFICHGCRPQFPRYLNQSAVASCIVSGVQTGAFFQ